MAASEEDIIRDQNERNNLQRAIADVEAAIAASTPGARRTLENFLEQAKKRVVVLEKKIEESTHERETAALEKVAMAARLAEKEAKLSEQEKEIYGGFLAKEFFTKKDFGKLENFYAHAWDRLSEGGKDEMSHRVWEGIRHGEYRFDELPRAVREKEEDRIYANLTTSSKKFDSLEQTTEGDRNDFIRAYKAGNRDEIGRVLNRESFRETTARGAPSTVQHRTADAAAKSSDDQRMVAKATAESVPSAKSVAASAVTKADIDALNLPELKLADVTAAPSVANMPDAAGTRAAGRG